MQHIKLFRDDTNCQKCAPAPEHVGLTAGQLSFGEVKRVYDRTEQLEDESQSRKALFDTIDDCVAHSDTHL